MAYGFQIKNALGEDILDDRKVLYRKASGITRTASFLDMNLDTGVSQLFYSQAPRFESPFVTDLNVNLAGFRMAASGAADIVGTGSPSLGEQQFATPTWPVESMAFYQIGALGLTYSLAYTLPSSLSVQGEPPMPRNCFYSRAGDGQFDPGSALPYIIVTTDLENQVGNYGMQTFNAEGVLTFDSRENLFAIQEVLFIPKEDVESCLLNNTVHNYALSKATPGAYISCNFFCAVHTSSGRSQHRPRIRQTTTSNLRMDRFFFGTNYFDELPTYVHDIVVFVARDPFA